MRGERGLLRMGEYLVGRACQGLPQDIRAERYREWAAELPAILHDPQIRLAPWRAIRMLGYAADTLRGTAMTAARARPRTPRVTAWLYLLLAAGLVNVVWNIWVIVRAPGHGQNYLQLTWSLLFVALPISLLVPLRHASAHADHRQRHSDGCGREPLERGTGTGGLGELFRGSVAASIPCGCVAHQPMVRPRQA